MKKGYLINIILFFLMSIVGAQDIIVPPELDYVSVINQQGHVEINWSYDEPDSIDGFIIYYLDPTKDPAPSIPFATLLDPLATTYVDESGRANLSSVPYTVAAFKEISDTIVTSKLTEPHFTVYLEEDWVECESSIKLNWNRYIGWDSDSIFYDIYENNILVERTSDTFFVNIDAENNQIYQYTIVAVNKGNGLTSKSNIVTQRTSFPIPVDYINADFATVDGESISLSFTLGNNGISYDYILLAKPPGSDIFSDSLTTFDYSNQLDYSFLTANVLEQYQFKLLEIDRCSRVIKESNISSNIVLQGEKSEKTVNLNWSEYSDWLGGVESYHIYRITGDGEYETYNTGDSFYQDDISDLIDEKQVTSVSYYIEAVEGGSNPYINQPQYSRSNIITIYLESELEFPTAFTPNGDGMNDIFRPINLYFVPTDYQLIVFDRWGKKVFETSQVDEGWDGKFSSGKNVLEGVYHYHVKYKNAEGIETSRTGIVTVIYP